MIFWIVAWALWSLTVWYQVNYWLPERRAIIGCTHRTGNLQRAVPDARRGGRYTALVWQCAECPLQIPLLLHRVGETIPGPEARSLWAHLHEDDGR